MVVEALDMVPLTGLLTTRMIYLSFTVTADMLLKLDNELSLYLPEPRKRPPNELETDSSTV